MVYVMPATIQLSHFMSFLTKNRKRCLGNALCSLNRSGLNMQLDIKINTYLNMFDGARACS